HRGATGVAGISLRVQLVHVRRAVQLVGADAGIVAEAPALVGQDGFHHRDGDDPVQALEPANHERARRPGTDQGYVQVIAVRLRGETSFARRTRFAIRRNPVSELRRLSNESPVRVFFLNRVPLPGPFTVYQHVIGPW